MPISPDPIIGIDEICGVRPATCADDNQGRAISSEHAGGAEKVTVAYNAVPAAHRHRTV